MWNKQAFEERLKNKSIDIFFWGRHGKEVLEEVEKQLNFQFDQETQSFIKEAGNLGIGSYSIVIAGNQEGTSNCILESEDVGLLDDGYTKGVKIMDSSGLSYVLSRDGSIKSYEHDYIEPDGVINSYNSLSDLLEKLIEEELLDQ